MSFSAKTTIAALVGVVAATLWLAYGSDGDAAGFKFAQVDGAASSGEADAEGQRPAAAAPATPVLGGATAPAAQPPAPTAAAPAASSQPVVDETALRYFARQGDTKRLEAEIARLRALYPSWTPPADPTAAPPQVDAELDRMWKLYSESKYAEVRQAIADRQNREANWQPPQDLLDRLAVAEARERLINASNLKQYETVLRVAATSQSLLTCADLDVLWRVGEAFALTKQEQRARDAYKYVLTNCTDPAERLATMQKAVGLLPRPLIDELLVLEKPAADGKPEFAGIRADLVRKSVAAGATEAPQPVPEADVIALEAIAREGKEPSDAKLLGWYYLRKNDPANAEKWFSAARETTDDVESAEGLGLALIALDRPAEAEEILFKWRDESENVGKDYLAAAANLIAREPRTPIDEKVLQRIVPFVVQGKDAPSAQQLGWYAHAFGQEEAAARWFSTALKWNPDEEAAAYGLAVVRLTIGDKKGVAEVQRAWAGRSERIATVTEPQIRTAALDQAARAARNSELTRQETQIATGESSAQRRPQTSSNQNSGSNRNSGGGGSQSRRGCSATDLYSSSSGATALTRAWCLMELDRPAEAVEAFENAIRTGNAATRSEAAWGQSLANLRLGLPDKAALSASKAPQDGQRARDLEANILSLRATGFFERKRYAETILALDQRARIAPERRDLMVLRGYAYLGLHRVSEARQIFEAIAASGDAEGARGLAAVQAVTNPIPQNN